MAIYDDETGVWKWATVSPIWMVSLVLAIDGVSHGISENFGRTQIVERNHSFQLVTSYRYFVCGVPPSNLFGTVAVPIPAYQRWSTGRDHWKNHEKRPYWRVYRMWKYDMLYISYHIIPHHIISYHIIPYHTISYHISHHIHIYIWA